MQIEKQITLDILPDTKPALSATSDMPVIETKPDAQNKGAPPKDGDTPKDTAAPAADAPAKADATPAGEKAAPEKSATQETPADESAASDEPKKAKGVQKRLDELVRQREDERRAREASEARLDRALSALERLTGKPAAEAKQEIEQDDPEPVRPVKAQFPSDDAFEAARDEYTEKKARWIARREVQATIAERERKAVEVQAQEEQSRVRDTYRGRVEKVVEKYPDYHDVAESPDVAITIPMAHAIMQSDFGPELQYHLGKNPAEAERISKLPVPAQLLALGRLEASFAAASKVEEKPETPAPAATPAPKPAVSSAPPPVKPVKAGNADAVKDPNEMSMEEYAAYRKKQLASANSRPGARH